MAYLLLTGATGLLGGYLLRDLLRAEVPTAVLVRPTASVSAARRIDAVLAPWERERALPRPVVLSGELTHPGLGLSEHDRTWLAKNCRSVLHSAASITFYRDERTGEPYRSNVEGLQNLLAVCRDIGVSEFHHVSTAYVSGRRSGRVTESELAIGQAFGNDYEPSKVQSEQLIHAARFERPATIYRPSIIFGDSLSGYTTTFHGFYTPLQLVFMLYRTGAIHGDVGAWFLSELGLRGDERKNLVPVDWVSRAIVDIVQRSDQHGRTYHLTNPSPPTTREITDSIGEAINRRFQSDAATAARNAPPVDAAAGRLAADEFRRHMDTYRAYFRDDPQFDAANTQQALPHLPCPRVDQAMLAGTASYALDVNFGWPRSVPPEAPLDISDALEQSLGLRIADDAVSATYFLNAVGCGGGEWTLSVQGGVLRSIERGRNGTSDAAARWRTDVWHAVLQGRTTVAEVIHAGRLLIAGPSEHAVRLQRGIENMTAAMSTRSKASDGSRPMLDRTTRISPVRSSS